MSTDNPPEDFPSVVYAGALVLYVALGYITKSLVLNWIVGPLFLVVVLYVLPASARRLHSALRGGHR